MTKEILEMKFNDYIEKLEILDYSLRDLNKLVDEFFSDNLLCEKITKKDFSILKRNSTLLNSSLKLLDRLINKANNISFLDFSFDKPKQRCKFYIFPLINDENIEVDTRDNLKDIWNKFNEDIE